MWDDVYAWVLTEAATLAAIERVYDGPPRQDPTEQKYAIVGGDDPAGTFVQDADPVDTFTGESGDIVLRLISRSGDDDLTPHRATTKTWVDTFTAAVNGDQTLGHLLRQGSTAHISRVETRQVTSGGVYVERAVTLSYTTRL